MVEGTYHEGKKKVKVGRTYYHIANDKRQWQPVLKHGQRVQGKLHSPAGGDAHGQRNMIFDLDSLHLNLSLPKSRFGRKK
jgi:hypothetical protein